MRTNRSGTLETLRQTGRVEAVCLGVVGGGGCDAPPEEDVEVECDLVPQLGCVRHQAGRDVTREGGIEEPQLWHKEMVARDRRGGGTRAHVEYH